MTLQKFQKPSLTSQEHIQLLLNRGLIIPDEAMAHHYLEFVGYYRLSGYFWFFYNKQAMPNHEFHIGANFKTIVDIYEFDAALRSLLLRSIEKIEVAARAVISNMMCEQYGAHWYMDKDLFKSSFRYDDFTSQVKKDTEFDKDGGRKLPFRSYYTKYNEPKLPASWMVFDVLSLGTLSKVYDYIKIPEIKKAIASKFNLPHYSVFSSWLQAVSFTRNLCAHHLLVCYRNFHIVPLKPREWTTDQQKIFSIPKGSYLQLAIIQYLLHSVAPNIKLNNELAGLLSKYPEVKPEKMGFPVQWDEQSIWT